MLNQVSLIGAPTDIGAGARGASMGPEALRVANIGAILEAHGLQVRDRGNLIGPANPWQPPVGGYRHLPEVVAWNQLVHDAVFAELQDGRLPILLGGDHCLGLGSISAVARHCRAVGKKLRILWLDAHADFNTNELTPSGNVHGMPVSCLCGYAPNELTRMSGGQARGHRAGSGSAQIGIRSVDQPARNASCTKRGPGSLRHALHRRGGHAAHALRWRWPSLPGDAHLHVSFDVDFLDPDIAPGVGTTVPGGPTYREAQLCMEMIADTGRLASLDVMELNPALDIRNKTADLAVDLIESLFGKSTLMRT